MDLNKIIKESNNNSSGSVVDSGNSAVLARESIQDPRPIVQEGQEAPSLAAPIREMRREVKMLNKKGELAIKLLAELKQKNLGDIVARNQIFKILNTRNESGQTLLTQVYESQNEASIRIVEETLTAILHTPVCISSKMVSGIFQLLEVLKPEAMDSVASYVLDVIRLLSDPRILVSGRGEIHEEPACLPELVERREECTENVTKDSDLSGIARRAKPECVFDEPREQKTWFPKKSIEALKSQEVIHDRQNIPGGEPIVRQLSLYFLYGFLSQNNAVLEAITALIKSQDEEVQAQFEAIIQVIFSHILNDFERPYCRAYFTSSSIYDSTLLYACKTYPLLLQQSHSRLLAHFLKQDSQGKLIELLILPTPGYSCFLDFIYSNLEPTASISLPQKFWNAFRQLQEWLHTDRQLAYLIPILRNLQLPHLLKYLLTVPLEILSKEEKMRYLFLSICLKHIDCIHRFKSIRIETEEASDVFQLLIIKVFQDLFNVSNKGKLLDRSLEERLFQTPAVSVAPKELFFAILESLKPLNVLICPPLMAILLSNSLNYDIQHRPSTSTFDYVLTNLMRLGFDLHFKEPVKQGNLIFEAFDLENVHLIQKLIALGVNPFLMNKDGFSFFKIEKLLSQIPGRREFYAQWKAQNLSVLKLVGLDQHPFLNNTFAAQLLKKEDGINTIDEQGRTPLMLWVKCNQDIQPLLKYITMEALDIKDKTEKCVVDYARENNDIVTLNLLEKHKTKLKKKSGFRKLASRFVSKNQGQGKSISSKSTPNVAKPIGHRPAKQTPSQEAATANAIYLDYDSQTEHMKTSYSQTEIQKEAEEKISKAERKRKAKEEKALKKKEENVPSQSGHPKKSVYEKIKHTGKAVGEALEAVSNLRSHPSALLGKWVQGSGRLKHLERLAQAPTTLNLGKGKSVSLLGDGSKAGAFKGLTGLAQDVIQAKLKEAPTGHILETLEDIEEAIRKNPQKKIERRKLLEALQWMVGGDIEDGKGSHMNLRFKGGGLTIPRNQRDGSENADIVYIRQVADRIEWSLRALILGYEMTSSQDSDSFVTEKEESSE